MTLVVTAQGVPGEGFSKIPQSMQLTGHREGSWAVCCGVPFLTVLLSSSRQDAAHESIVGSSWFLLLACLCSHVATTTC